MDDLGARASTVALARSSLADARGDLDDAVSSLSNISDETILAASNLVDLLLRVVAARHHLEDVERRPLAGPLAPVR